MQICLKIYKSTIQLGVCFESICCHVTLFCVPLHR